MRTFTEIDVPQRSPEWLAARVGLLTGSVCSEAFATIKSGGWSTSRRNLLLRLALERLTGKSMERDFVSRAMQDGIDREDDAVAAYELHAGVLVMRSGFLRHTELRAGASLDGYLGDYEHLLSIKCRQPNAHLEFLRYGKIPNDALYQMRHELWLTGATGHTYCSFNPDFPAELRLRATTLSRHDLHVTGYDRAVRDFLAEVDAEHDAIATLVNLPGQLQAAGA